jgi:hypothetical protein
MHVFFLFAQEVRGDGVEGVAAELVVALHCLQQN